MCCSNKVKEFILSCIQLKTIQHTNNCNQFISTKHAAANTQLDPGSCFLLYSKIVNGNHEAKKFNQSTPINQDTNEHKIFANKNLFYLEELL